MTRSDHREKLINYHDYIIHNKYQLLDISRRHDALTKDLASALSGELYVCVDDYLKQLRVALNACESVRLTLEKTLTAME